MNLHDVMFSTFRAMAGQRWLHRPLNRALAPFNPFDPQRHTNPYPLYEQARSAEPVFYNRLAQFWMVTGYEEAQDIMRGPVSVNRRAVLEPTRPYNRMATVNVDLLMSNMLMSDPPSHGRLRRLVNRSFTRNSIAHMQPRIELLSKELIEDLTPRDDIGSSGASSVVDVMEGLANRLPIYAIGEMLGIPRGRRDELKALSDVVAQFVDPFNLFNPTEMDEAINELRDMISGLAEERAADPRPDLISELVQAEADGDRLDREELVSMVILLLIAGHETSADLIGNALVALSRNPRAKRQLIEDPSLVPNAVEELLRYDSPIQVTDRTVVQSFTVDGKTIPEGSLVLILLGAANHDPRRYRNAGELQLDRQDPTPISFGHGIHHCIGAHLARMEAQAVLPAFVSTFPDYQVSEDGLAWKHSTTFRGPSRLPVTLEPASGPALSAEK
jgi:cytochrome P450